MRTPPAVEGPAALREEIRRAGAAAFLARLVSLELVAIGALALVFALAFIFLRPVGQIVLRFDALGNFLTLLGSAGLVTTFVGVPTALAVGAGCRLRRRSILRRKLAALSPDQLAAVLALLREDRSSDTRKLLAPLLRELETRITELTPAAPPPGSGTELLPSERST